MRWLVVSPYLPHASIPHGGGNAVYNLCRALARVHETTLLCFRRHGEEGLEKDLVAVGVRVEMVDFLSDAERGSGRLRLIADRAACWLRAQRTGRPLMVEKYQRAAMHRRLHDEILGWKPDVVQVEYGFLAPYARHARQIRSAHRASASAAPTSVRAARPQILLNTHELVSLARLRRLAASGSMRARRHHARELTRWAAHEHHLPDCADHVLCVTDQDRVLLHGLTGAENLRTVPLGVELESLPVVSHTDDGAARLLFVGSFTHPPNVAAARVLVDELFPRLQEERADLSLDFIGNAPPAWLTEAANRSEGKIRVHGFVEDLAGAFEAASIFVAPLFSGGGIKIKILEAMGRGAAVVTTPIGVEGIDEEACAVALGRDVEALTREVLRLLADPEARRTLGQDARRAMERDYGWSAIVATLTRLVTDHTLT